MGKAVLTIEVDIDETIEVKGSNGEACMIRFHGKSDCENFKGEIMPGGVDTQKQIGGNARTLSARYVLEGRDYTGTFCKIFVENNATVVEGEKLKTKPIILTDSNALKWMENADLYGTVTERTGGVLISIYQNHEKNSNK